MTRTSAGPYMVNPFASSFVLANHYFLIHRQAPRFCGCPFLALSCSAPYRASRAHVRHALSSQNTWTCLIGHDFWKSPLSNAPSLTQSFLFLNALFPSLFWFLPSHLINFSFWINGACKLLHSKLSDVFEAFAAFAIQFRSSRITKLA